MYKKNKFGHTFNVGSGKPVSINSLVKILDKKYENIPKRPGEPDVTHANIGKIQQLTGWRPKILFKDGIYEILNNISYWKDAPLWSKQKIKVATKSWFKYLK